MSRILEALRRIEVQQHEDASVPCDAVTVELRCPEADLPPHEETPLPENAPLTPDEPEKEPEKVPEKAPEKEPEKVTGTSCATHPSRLSDNRCLSPSPGDPAEPPGEERPVAPVVEERAREEETRADPQSEGRYAELADHILKEFPPGRCAVLMLTSPGGEDGKTRVTAGLAEALAARTADEVLAVDGDLEHPQLARRLRSDRIGEPDRCSGLAGVLAGEVAWQGAVCRTPRKGLDVLPGGKAVGRGPGVTLGGLEGLIEELRPNYRFVVMDAPSLAHPEATAVARCGDGVFLVVTLGQTGRRAARQAVSILRHGGAHVLGCVVTGGQEMD